MSNIAEGFNRGGNNEFRQFLAYARGSAGEVRSRSQSALTGKHFLPEHYTEIESKTIECEKLIAGLIRYLKESERKGWAMKAE